MWRVLFIALMVFFGNMKAQASELEAMKQEEQAVALARSGHHAEALAQLEKLANSGLQAALLDEIVILGWADRHQEAISLYENASNVKWPEYVQLSVAGSYYREGLFKKAAALYHQNANNNIQAKRWEAECLMRLGDKEGAQKIYIELLADNPEDKDTYISRGNLRILAGDIQQGIEDLDIALAMITDIKQQTTIRAQLATIAIRNGDYNRGINYLKPSIMSNTATEFMQADYIFALRLNGDFAVAAQEARRLWTDYKAVPAYGLQALADSYLRSKQYRQAIEVYNILLTRKSEEINRRDVLGGLAFAAIREGLILKSKEVYTSLFKEYPSYASVALGDMSALLDNGQYQAAQELGGVITSEFPDNVLYRQQVAFLLSRQGLYRAAAEEYQKISNLPGSQPMAGAGLAVSALAAGDYKAAREGVERLDQQSKRPMIAQAIKKFDERPTGNTEANVIMQKDYKGNDTKDVSLSVQQQLSDRAALSLTLDNKMTADRVASVHYKGIAPGLIYKDLKQMVKASWNLYSGDINASGYQLGYTRYFGDQSSLGLELNRMPIEQAAGIEAGIMVASQRLFYNKSVGKLDSYTGGITRSLYSDGNAAFGYDGNFTHIYYDKNNIVRDWQVYFNRNSFKHQEINGTATPYESPALRVAYGVALRQRWNSLASYWENTFGMEWSQDKGEKFSCSPYDRLTYNHRIGLNQQLSLGIEYGLRTVNSGGGLWFDYSTYTIIYEIYW